MFPRPGDFAGAQIPVKGSHSGAFQRHAQALLGLFDLIDIDQEGDESCGMALFFRDPCHRQVAPGPITIRASVTFFHDKGNAIHSKLFKQRLLEHPVFRVAEPADRMTQQFLAGVTHDLAVSVIHLQQHALLIGLRDTGKRLSNHGAQPLFAGLAGSLGTSLLLFMLGGDVIVDADHADRLPAGIVFQGGGRMDMADLPAGQHDAEAMIENAMGTDRLLQP